MKKVIWFLPVALGVLFLFSAPPKALAAVFKVNIGDDYFEPFAPMILPGDSILWTNKGTTAHTVTADDGSFDSGSLSPGATYSHTFSQVGIVNYYCKIHSNSRALGGNAMNAVIL